MQLLPEMMDAGCEGNISWFENRQNQMIELLISSKPEKILEIGFNVGHSAMLICNTIEELKNKFESYKNKKIEFYVFDICVCSATKHNFEVLKKKYQKTLEMHLIVGDSMTKVPEFFKSNDIKFDFIEIDGCHTSNCLVNDVKNTIDHLTEKGLIYIDDYKSEVFPIKEVDHGVESIIWDGFDTDFIDGVFWAKKINRDSESVNHPSHYGGENNKYEVIKVIEALNMDFHMGNAFKYIARSGKKDPEKEIEDLKKAVWYINRKIELLQK